MISYELSYGLALASVLLVANSMSLSDIVNRQSGTWLGIHPAVVRLPPAGRVSDLHDRRHRGDQSRAV